MWRCQRYHISVYVNQSISLPLSLPLFIALGNYGYLGTFKNKKTGISSSLKIISKKRACDSQMDINILKDRQIVAALTNISKCLTTILSVYQNDKIVMLEYSDLFRCELSLAIQNNAIPDKAKMYYAACIYAALASLHENAVINRFISSSSVYITDRGVPKLVGRSIIRLISHTVGNCY
jgi:serine/threonine protein kinase